VPLISSPTVTFVGDFMTDDGYGSMNEYLVRGLHRAGASVSVSPVYLNPIGLSSEFLALLLNSRAAVDGPVLYCSFPRSELRSLTGTELFIRTMYEASAIPPHWPGWLNRARAVIVPSRFVARVFRDAGVHVPIAVVPEGIDPDVYRLEHRRRRAGLTTLMVAALSGRKHWREGVAAWRHAFQHDPEARLIIKSRSGMTDGLVADDARIRVVSDSEHGRGIAHWYREADVLLALGSEGFGLPMIEAMATGLPVIALDSEGQADACRDARDLVLPVKPVRWETHHHIEDGAACGVRAVPGIEEVAAKLRWVAEHREEAAAMGTRASAWAHRYRNVWSYGPAVLSVLEEHTRCRASLVRRP
jgi:glycosyltransferase involved in cell wall biosynthesis